MVRRRRPPLSADGRGRGLPAVSPTRRRRRSKWVAEIAENAGIDGNEVLECSRVTCKSPAEIAEIPCKYFARKTARNFTVWEVPRRGRRGKPQGQSFENFRSEIGEHLDCCLPP